MVIIQSELESEAQYARNAIKGTFTLLETETDKMTTVPNGIAVSVQFEHHPYNSLQAIFIRLGLHQCEH